MENEIEKTIKAQAWNCYKRLIGWAKVKYSIEDLVNEGFDVLYSIALPNYNPEKDMTFRSWFTQCLISYYGNIVKKENRHCELRIDTEAEFENADEGGEQKLYIEAQEQYQLTPEHEAIIRQAISRLQKVCPEFVELMLGESIEAYTNRKKLMTKVFRANEKHNANPKFIRPQIRLRMTEKLIEEFLDIKRKKFSEIKEIFYNTV